MDAGIYIAASGAATAMYRLDVLTNNLANTETAGFKADIARVRQRASARVEDGLGSMSGNELLDRLGGGAHIMPSQIDFTQGAIKSSGNALDVAIEGDGFFAVQSTPDADGNRTRLTRDGRFMRNREGLLVNTDGMLVLDESMSPIRLALGAPVKIDGDGTIRQGGTIVAQLAVIDVPDRSRLAKSEGGTLWAPAGDLDAAKPAKGLVRQFHTEQSSVDPVKTLMRITDAQRSAESNLSTIQTADRLNDRLINSFARLA